MPNTTTQESPQAIALQTLVKLALESRNEEIRLAAAQAILNFVKII